MLLDFRGNEITVGSTIVYPSRRGSNIWMHEAYVTEVSDGSITVIPLMNNLGKLLKNNPVKLVRHNTIVVVE